MANIHAILAIIGSALAALTALIIVGAGVLLPAVFAIGAGIYLALQHKEDKWVLASGALAALLGIVAALGAFGGLTFGEGGGVDFSAIGGGIASALAIFACLEVVASLLKANMDDLPKAGAYGTAGALAIAVILAFVFNADLGSQAGAGPWLVAVLSLVGLYPGIVALKS